MSEPVHDAKRLAELQALPFERKIQITQTRIIEWYRHYNGNVCVSFSGGKDSTVLLHIARRLYPDIPAVFSDTGLEYAEIRAFARSWDNVDVVRPKMNFAQVISRYGYPLIGKEVAEAIYYARRIRSDASAERERETGGVTLKTHTHTPRPGSRPETARTTWRKKQDLQGCRGTGRDWKSGGGEEPPYPDERIEKQEDSPHRTDARSRGSWEDWRRKCLIGQGDELGNWHYDDKTRRRYELRGFRNAGVADGKSQFNKEKWLPLARDVPVLISHYCCHKMKKSPMHKYQSQKGYKPILATLAEESRVRKQGWIRHGCNAFESKNPMSQPMSFWTEHDVLEYIVRYNVPISSVYGDIVGYDDDGNIYNPTDLMGNVCGKLKCTGCQRTGCVFCAFGAHLDKGETRFQLLARLDPQKYEFCIGGGEWIDNPYYDPTAPKMDGEWQNWNPKKIWSRNSKGLGMGKVFDMVNEIYGKDFYRYE